MLLGLVVCGWLIWICSLLAFWIGDGVVCVMMFCVFADCAVLVGYYFVGLVGFVACYGFEFWYVGGVGGG